MKQLWIPRAGNMPLFRNVLIEKTVKDDCYLCLFINGLPVYSFFEEPLKKHRIFITKPYDNQTAHGVYVNMPIEVFTKHSEIIWRISKKIYKSKQYRDYINNRTVINRL